MDSNQLWHSTYDMLPLGFSTLATSDDGILFAGTIGSGVYQFSALRSWERVSQGFPEEIQINRLDWVDAQLFASTNRGLYRLDDDVWQATSLRAPCYRILSWGDQLVLTDNGLMCGSNWNWLPYAYPGKKAFDLMVTPHFLFLGYEEGIAYYDVFMSEWWSVSMDQPIKSLAVYNQMVLGTTADGGLVLGNKNGGFQQIRFEGMYIYRLVTTNGDVYACANTGIYKISDLKGRIMLRSMSIQASVTDLLIWNNMMFISTLNSGIRYSTLNRSGFQSNL
ncbi:hypothetical protein GC098_01720 [Paenibacillus sp. LMG 31458]|uniref:Uncharacterized protein n=1 Tax=Paenibacillus phytorum TaxID=2654977 RepID=A0ABX1XNW0_9BACL|nr:hypothetical protein [Paenibacillus phytorum]NOU70166.1 hypothetical protein [Paenibacillus phytorum]